MCRDSPPDSWMFSLHSHRVPATFRLFPGPSSAYPASGCQPYWTVGNLWGLVHQLEPSLPIRRVNTRPWSEWMQVCVCLCVCACKEASNWLLKLGEPLGYDRHDNLNTVISPFFLFFIGGIKAKTRSQWVIYTRTNTHLSLNQNWKEANRDLPIVSTLKHLLN